MGHLLSRRIQLRFHQAVVGVVKPWVNTCTVDATVGTVAQQSETLHALLKYVAMRTGVQWLLFIFLIFLDSQSVLIDLRFCMRKALIVLN